MEDHFAAWRAALEPHSLALKPEDYFPLEGTPLRDLAARYLGPTADRHAVDALISRKEAYYLTHHSLKLYPGVEALLVALRKRGVALGIVTAGLRDRIERSVPARFLARFDTVVTGDHPPRGKPFPDPYLAGAKALNVAANECLAVENAPLGVESAKSAGMYCVAVCSTVAAGHLSRADETVPSFSDLPSSRALAGLLGRDE